VAPSGAAGIGAFEENMSRAQRVKGARFERELVSRLRAVFGSDVRRGLQFRDGAEAADVMLPAPIHIEAKHDNGISVWAAMRQAVRDAKPGSFRLVVLKHDRQEPIAAMPYEDFEEMLKQWWQAVNR
jgi:hypothetical protein